MEKQNFEELYKKLEEEKSETTLKDLEIHQKRKAIILVSETLDIVKVGTHIALDDKTIIQTWLEKKLVQNIEDHEFEKLKSMDNKMVSFIIIQPFVLIQLYSTKH